MKDCDIIESFDRKFEKFRSKDSELEESGNEILESFDRKLEKFRSTDSGFSVPANEPSESFGRMIESFELKDSGDTVRVSRNESKVDGRTKPRSVKQMEAYKRNFDKRNSIELRIRELDARMRHLQSLVLGVLRGERFRTGRARE